MKFSVIIPTKNEEKNIANVLSDLKNQTLQPTEIIIADDSKDKTRNIVKQFNAKIVQGISDGRIGLGRNLGAKIAKEDLLIFLDADVKMQNTFLANVISKFSNKNLDIATTLHFPVPNTLKGNIILWAQNIAKRLNTLTGKVLISETGDCIIVKRKVFQKIRGFNETKLYGEDVDFIVRATNAGFKYTVLPDKIGMSMRRYVNKSYLDILTIGTTGILSILFYKTNGKIFKKPERFFRKKYGATGSGNASI